MSSFSIDDNQQKKLDAWLKEQTKAACDIQIARLECKASKTVDDQIKIEMCKKGTPYYGAIGGSITYQFTPTGLGVICKVIHNFTKAEIDITDYENW